MIKLLKLEEIMLFTLGFYLFSLLSYPIWIFFAVLFIPDISMIGYLLNEKQGAMLYNLVHHRGLAILMYLLGYTISMPMLMLVGLMLFSHSTLDRVFGYGLKYQDSFKHTHLGTM